MREPIKICTALSKVSKTTMKLPEIVHPKREQSDLLLLPQATGLVPPTIFCDPPVKAVD